MTIEELKNQILDNQIQDGFMIFECKKNTFLAEQYLNEICARKNCGINKINSIAEAKNSALSLVFSLDCDINVLNTDTFSEPRNDYSTLNNFIVVCNSIDKTVKKQVADYVISFPELLDWQVKDYMTIICPGLSKEDYDWLYGACSGNICRIINELDKVALFDETERPGIIASMKAEKSGDLFDDNIFSLIDGIVSKDFNLISGYLTHLNYLTQDPIGFSSLLLKNYKNAAYARSGKSERETGLSSKQVYAISKKMGHISQEELFEKLRFLSNIDLRLKTNALECKSISTLISYIINKVLA